MDAHISKCIFLFIFGLLAACGGGGSDGSSGYSTSSTSSSSSSSSTSSSSSSTSSSTSSSGTSSSSTSSSGSSSSSSSSSSSTSSTSSSTSGGFSALSDEFEGETVDLLLDNTSDWQVLHPEMSDGIDIGLTVEGALTMLALSTEPEAIQGGWFEDEYASLVYKNITGNFSVVTKLRVVDRNDPIVTDIANIGQGPDGAYSAGGFVLRDASGTHNNDEDWLMYNMGGQGLNGVSYAREIKKTVNSVSNLFLTQQNTVEEYLLACRVGDFFYFYTWNENTGTWRQETYYNNVDVDGEIMTTGTPTGFSVVTEFFDPGFGNSMPMYFELDLPDTIQVGVISHAWGSPYETRAEYDFIHFAQDPPASQGDCINGFTAPE